MESGYLQSPSDHWINFF